MFAMHRNNHPMAYGQGKDQDNPIQVNSVDAQKLFEFFSSPILSMPIFVVIKSSSRFKPLKRMASPTAASLLYAAAVSNRRYPVSIASSTTCVHCFKSVIWNTPKPSCAILIPLLNSMFLIISDCILFSICFEKSCLNPITKIGDFCENSLSYSASGQRNPAFSALSQCIF